MNIAVTHMLTVREVPGQLPFHGADSHLFDLMNGQLALGLEVNCVMSIAQDGAQLRAKAEELARRGIRVTRLVMLPDPTPGTIFAKASNIMRLVSLFRRRRGHVFHMHTPWDLQMGCLAAVIAGCRYLVHTVHEPFRAYAWPRWQYLLFPLLRRLSLRHIAVSGAVADYLKTMGGIESVVIHNGIAVRSPGNREAARQALGLPSAGFVVGFVGRLTPAKNVSCLLQAMTLLPDCLLAVVGDGPDRGSLETEARELGLRNVRFLGAQPDAQSLMPAFDVMVLPSRWEGLPLVLLEAIQQGVPVVASSVDGSTEILQGSEAGLLFDVDDSAALAEHIALLRDNPEARERYAAAGFAHVRANFTAERMTKQVVALYEEILSGSLSMSSQT